MLIEAFEFSSAGVQLQPPPGHMLSNRASSLQFVPLMILPGLLITVVVLCLYIIGDGLRDAFDPTATD